MKAELVQALGELLGPRLSERDGKWVLAPSGDRELARVLEVLAAHKAALAAPLLLSRESFSYVGPVEPESSLIHVGAGALLRRVEESLLGHGLSLGPLSRGIMDQTLAEFLEGPYGGLRVVAGGRLEPVPVALKVMLPDGHVFRSHQSPRSAAGADLDALYLGGQGRTGLVLSAVLRCFPGLSRRAVSLLFPDVSSLLGALRWAIADGAWVGRAWVVPAKRPCLQVELVGAPGQLELDQLTLAAAATRFRGSPEQVSVTRAVGVEREVSWDELEAELERGHPVTLHRPAQGSVVATGIAAGVALGAAGRWSESAAVALAAQLDPAGTLGGAP